MLHVHTKCFEYNSGTIVSHQSFHIGKQFFYPVNFLNCNDKQKQCTLAQEGFNSEGTN